MHEEYDYHEIRSGISSVRREVVGKGGEWKVDVK